MIGEVKAVFDLADKAQIWLTSVVQSKRNKKKQAAAHLLAAAGVLVGTFHSLLSQFKSSLGQFALFDSHWPLDRREAAIDGFRGFILQDLQIPLIQQKVSELEELLPGAHDEDKEFVKTLIDYGRRFLEAIEPSDLIHVWPNNRSLFDFLRTVRSAQSEEQAAFVADSALVGLDALSSIHQSEADSGYGSLRARILRRYPDLAPPDWDTNLQLTVSKPGLGT